LRAGTLIDLFDKAGIQKDDPASGMESEGGMGTAFVRSASVTSAFPQSTRSTGCVPSVGG
jgi:hypothetical protein